MTPTQARREAIGAPSSSQLAARIRAAREAVGLTQSQAARLLRMSPQSYHDRETTTRLPYAALVEMLRVTRYDPAIICPELYALFHASSSSSSSGEGGGL